MRVLSFPTDGDLSAQSMTLTPAQVLAEARFYWRLTRVVAVLTLGVVLAQAMV